MAAFNIGFGAKTAVSSFQIFPGATWKAELAGDAARKLEHQWADVELLIVDEVSFIGRAFFTRMHFRLQQGKRRTFSEWALDPNECTFGNLSIILVGDFGQLEPIDDWNMCDRESRACDQPKRLQHLWKHAQLGKELLKEFDEAFMLTRIHRSGADVWWTESCLRLRDFEMGFAQDWQEWLKHDLDRHDGHLTSEQIEYFENMAVWLCARCEDVGCRNGRKLAHLAMDTKEIVHRIHAQHSCKSAKKYDSKAYAGLRGVVNLVRGCKVMLTRNVAYRYGLANGTRGTLIGVVYAAGDPVGAFPEALIVHIPEYVGPSFWKDEPQWVPLLPMTGCKEGTRMTRTQFPVVAGFALTVNKAQGLTIKEGVVIHLAGSRRFRPASKHGLPFVAFTRSENFAMTAFKNLPPFNDFFKGKESPMLRTRQAFVDELGGAPQGDLGQTQYPRNGEGGRKGTRALGCAAPSGGKAAKAASTRDALFCMRRCVGLIESTATDRLVWPWRVLRSTQRCPCARCFARDVWEETLDHTVTCEDPEFWPACFKRCHRWYEEAQGESLFLLLQL